MKQFLKRLHCGEPPKRLAGHTAELKSLTGQGLLLDLASALISSQDELRSEEITVMQRALELDGYLFLEGKLRKADEDVVPYEEELTELQMLYKKAGLDPSREDEAFGYLDASLAAYTEKRWKDSIADSRNFIETILQEVVSVHHQKEHGMPIGKRNLERAAYVREYLLSKGIIDKEEKGAIASLYRLLSDKGSHPAPTEPEQARLSRSLSQTLSQFIMNRLVRLSNENR